MEGRWHDVSQLSSLDWQQLSAVLFVAPRSRVGTKLTLLSFDSYNRYLAIAARTVRRSLKEDKRLAAERRGDMDLRFAKWEVRV